MKGNIVFSIVVFPKYRNKNKKGSVYEENRAGPQTEPCGTPQHTGAEEEGHCPTATDHELSDRFDLNHDKTEPLRPTTCLSLHTRML